MSKRTISATDSDGQAGPSAPKRARGARSTSRPPPFEEPRIRLNESSSEEEPDDDASVDRASLDIDDLLEEQIRSHIDATRAANAGHLGTVGQKGIIESVEMFEFMCHKHLSFKFGDRFNFIIGRNGSGKSAVLTAITIALGGKANSTGRGSGLKSFIREGQSISEVTITLKNDGDDAYKPETFGKRIIITRRFTSQGTSSYKILSDQKVAISTRKADLDDICDYMNIQVDNPLSVLTQDAARKFLGTTNAREKYGFFLRGTQLQQLSDEYELIDANIKTTDLVLVRKAGDLPDLKAALDVAQRDYDDGLKAQELRDRHGRLRIELAWAHCGDKEKELQQCFKVVADSDSRLTKMQAKLDDSKKQVDEASGEVGDLEARHEEAQERVRQTKVRRAAAIQEVLNKRREIKDLQNNEREMNITIEEYNTAITHYDEQIILETAKLEHTSQVQRDEFQARIDASKAKIAKLETDLAAAAAERDRIMGEITTADQEESQIKSQVETLQRKVKDLTEEISASHEQGQDRLAVFGVNLNAVLAAIKQGRWFGREPVGPLGLHVELGDVEKWGDIMRISIGHQMRAFAITDVRDHGQLKAILQRHKNYTNPIIISGYDMFDYHGGEPPPEYLTPLRTLKISNDYVRRILINSSGIERNYLVTDRCEAEDLMDQRGHGVVLTSSCFRVTRYQVDNGHKSEALTRVHFKDPRSRLFRDESRTSQISQLRGELARVQDHVKQGSDHLQHCRQRQAHLREALSNCKNNGRKIHGRVIQEKSVLETIEAEARDEAPISIAALHDGKKENEEAKAELVRQFTELQSNKVRLESELVPLQGNIDRLQDEVRKAEELRQALYDQLEDVVVQRAKAVHAQQHYTAELDKEKTKRDGLQGVADTVQIEFKDWMSKAEKIGEKVEVLRPLQTIQREHDALTRGLEQHDRIHLKTLTTLRKDLDTRRTAFETLQKEYNGLLKLNEVLKKSLKMRQGRWQEWRAICAIKCKIYFQYNMANRGYYGVVTFDHVDEKLNIKVQTDDQIVASQGSRKDPMSLSGGEKSFSTICLLLALWETLGCPIRCLDEFDVFMDEVNRQISAKMLMDTARSSHGKQYILITPLSINPRIIEPWVTIRQMADPERGGPTSA